MGFVKTIHVGVTRISRELIVPNENATEIVTVEAFAVLEFVCALQDGWVQHVKP
jgi:phosphate starvation-inducible membrane PsiE